MTTSNRLLVSSIGVFDCDNETFSNYWKRFNFFCKVNKVELELQAGVFLATVGPKTFALCQDLLAPKVLDEVTLNEIGKALSNHFNPVKNIIYERFVFFSRNQKNEETIKDYVHALKALATTCNFENNLNNMLRDRLVVGLRDQKIQRSLLTNADLTFDDAIRLAVSMDVATREVKMIQSGSINTINSKSDFSVKLKNSSKFNNSKCKTTVKIPSNYQCFSCGSKSHLRKDCKFKDSKCFSCNKVGHLKSVCKFKTQNKNIHVTKETSNENNVECKYIFSMDSKDPINLNIKIDGILIPIELDTGASRNIFP